MKTGLQILRDKNKTAEEIAELLAWACPPGGEKVDCDHITCKNCWLYWLQTGNVKK